MRENLVQIGGAGGPRSEGRTPRPEWLRIRLRTPEQYHQVKGLVDRLSLNTVCQEAGGSFRPSVSKERTLHTKFTFENPDDNTWYLVIDNMDNPRSDDATPTGMVNYEYTAPIEERHNEVIEMQIWGTGAAVAAAIIIVTIIVCVRIKMKG